MLVEALKGWKGYVRRYVKSLHHLDAKRQPVQEHIGTMKMSSESQHGASEHRTHRLLRRGGPRTRSSSSGGGPDICGASKAEASSPPAEPVTALASIVGMGYDGNSIRERKLHRESQVESRAASIEEGTRASQFSKTASRVRQYNLMRNCSSFNVDECNLMPSLMRTASAPATPITTGDAIVGKGYDSSTIRQRHFTREALREASPSSVVANVTRDAFAGKAATSPIEASPPSAAPVVARDALVGKGYDGNSIRQRSGLREASKQASPTSAAPIATWDAPSDARNEPDNSPSDLERTPRRPSQTSWLEEDEEDFHDDDDDFDDSGMERRPKPAVLEKRMPRATTAQTEAKKGR